MAQRIWFGKSVRYIATDGTAQNRAINKAEMPDLERVKFASFAWQIEQYHRGIKEYCLIEGARVSPRAAVAKPHQFVFAGVCAN